MKTNLFKQIFLIFFLAISQISYSHSRTFYMDTFNLKRGGDEINFNRTNCPINLNTEESSKIIYLGLLGKDSVYVDLKQGVFYRQSKPIPILIYTFLIKSETDIDSTTGHYLHEFPGSFIKSHTQFNLYSLHFSLKSDTNSVKVTIPKTEEKNSYLIIHQLENIVMGKSKFKNTTQKISYGIAEDSLTEKVFLGRYKNNPVYYTISINSINPLNQIKVIDINIIGNTFTNSYTLVMKGNEYISPIDNNRIFIYFRLNYKSLKYNTLRANHKIFISKNNSKK